MFLGKTRMILTDAKLDRTNDEAILGVNRYVITLIVNRGANEIDILATQNNGVIERNIK